MLIGNKRYALPACSIRVWCGTWFLYKLYHCINCIIHLVGKVYKLPLYGTVFFVQCQISLLKDKHACKCSHHAWCFWYTAKDMYDTDSVTCLLLLSCLLMKNLLLGCMASSVMLSSRSLLAVAVHSPYITNAYVKWCYWWNAGSIITLPYSRQQWSLVTWLCEEAVPDHGDGNNVTVNMFSVIWKLEEMYRRKKERLLPESMAWFLWKLQQKQPAMSKMLL